MISLASAFSDAILNTKEKKGGQYRTSLSTDIQRTGITLLPFWAIGGSAAPRRG
jgi:hypothetical protein